MRSCIPCQISVCPSRGLFSNGVQLDYLLPESHFNLFFWVSTVEPKICPKAKNRASLFWSCNCWFGFNGLIENSPNYQSSSPYNGQEGRWIRLLYFFIDEREARNSTVFCDVSYIFFYSSWLEIRRYFFFNINEQ